MRVHSILNHPVSIVYAALGIPRPGSYADADAQSSDTPPFKRGIVVEAEMVAYSDALGRIDGELSEMDSPYEPLTYILKSFGAYGVSSQELLSACAIEARHQDRPLRRRLCATGLCFLLDFF